MASELSASCDRGGAGFLQRFRAGEELLHGQRFGRVQLDNGDGAGLELVEDRRLRGERGRGLDDRFANGNPLARRKLLDAHRFELTHDGSHRRDVLGPRAVIAADQPRAFGHPARERRGKIIGAGGVIKAAFVELRLARVGKNGEQVTFTHVELRKQMHAGLRAAGAVQADHVGAGLAQECGRLPEKFGPWRGGLPRLLPTR